MRLVLAALVASTGCAQLFGIDETTRADADTSVASVQVQKVSIGASVVKGPLDMTAQMATFYDDTALTLAPVPGMQSAIDTFSAQVPGTPPVIFTVPDVQAPTRMLALPARAQRVNYVELEHPSPQDALPNSAIDLNITLPSAVVTGQSFSVQAIGAWMQNTLSAAEGVPLADMGFTTLDSPPIPYTSFTSMVGNPKYRITIADVVLVLRYTDPMVVGVTSALSGVFQAQFDQTDGTDIVSGTMTNVPAISTMTATIDPAGYATRFAAVRPGVAGASLGWRVSASPGWSLGVETGVRLISGAGTATDTSITGMYGNPFESLDWKALLLFTSTSSRAYTYTENAMMAAMNLSASMTAISEVGTTTAISLAAGLPITIQANDQTLVTDGMTLPLDLTKPVVIEATLDKPTNTYYQLTLVELGLDVSGTTPVVTRRTVVDAATAGAPQFRLPPELFTVGKSYFINFRAYQGGPTGAADGDLQTVTLPYSFASLDSAVFTVGMP